MMISTLDWSVSLIVFIAKCNKTRVHFFIPSEISKLPQIKDITCIIKAFVPSQKGSLKFYQPQKPAWNSCNSDPSMNTSIHDATPLATIRLIPCCFIFSWLCSLPCRWAQRVAGAIGSDATTRSSILASTFPRVLTSCLPRYSHPSPASPFLQTTFFRRKLDPIPCKAVAGLQCLTPRAGFCGFHHSDFFPCRYDIDSGAAWSTFDTVHTSKRRVM